MKSSPSDTLLGFMTEMNKWERSYNNSFMKNHSIDKTPFRDELNCIFERWCTLKERKTGRQISLKISFPPDYDPESDEVMDMIIGKDKASIIVQKHTGFKHKYRYTLHLTHGEWRIDKKEWLDDEDGKKKWVQAYL